MIERTIIAGAGGQGIMLLGRVLAEAAIKENKYVTWLPAYGAEVRGGIAHCMVVISDQEIGSPYIDQADTLIIMNGLALGKFANIIKNKGLLIVNSSLVSKDTDRNLTVLKYPFTDIAIKLGNIKVANTVALGCYLAKNKIIDIKNVLKVIEEIAPRGKKDLVEINKQAVLSGVKLIK
jgi:2-oxoglutarate ferredoxin oxidoreductase subunit gamma